MGELTRFGVSLDSKLLEAFDKKIKASKYETRSKAIADLITEDISKDNINKSGIISGAIIFIYEHHVKDLGSKMTDIQHDFHETIISMQHIHLDHDNCLEILAIKGETADIRKLFNLIKACKGVRQATIHVA